MSDAATFSTEMRHALSDHDTASPLTPSELLTFAAEMEKDLIAHECQFSHPDWRIVDGLRALVLALKLLEKAEREARGPAYQLNYAIAHLLRQEAP